MEKPKQSWLFVVNEETVIAVKKNCHLVTPIGITNFRMNKILL